MPVNDPDAVRFDYGTAILDYYLDQARADDSIYRQRVQERQAAEQAVADAAAAKESRRQRMVEIARRKRPGQKGKRAWQSLGLTKQQWLDQGRPDAPPMTPFHLNKE